MKKLFIMVIAAVAVCGGSPAIADPPAAPMFNWAGFYIGLNAGYAWSGSVESIGTATFANPPNQPTSGRIADALAGTGTYNLGAHNGFIGGGQIGYNWQFASSWVAGIEADFQGLAHHNNTWTQTASIPVIGFGVSYTAVQSASQLVDWLGTVRGRLGVLVTPSLLVYGTGGLAFGDVRMRASVNVQPWNLAQLLPVSGAIDISETRTGWTVGAGFEWMFAPNWSAKIEYLHYDLGRVSGSYTLTQVCTGILNCPGGNIIAAASVKASTRFDGDIVRVGVNYHF